MSKKLIQVIEETLLNSTSHGIPSIIRSDKLAIRLMWIIFTIISTGLCGFMIVQSILNYFSFETTSKIQVITETNAIFPTVTICNTNYFTTKYSAEFINNLSLEIPLGSNYFDYIKYYTIRKIILSDDELRSNSYKFGDTFKKLIINCKLSTIDCKSEEYWIYYYHQLYGNCYQINANREKLISVDRTGWQNSLSIILNISLADGLEGLFASIGAIVMIHNQTTSPITADPLTVSPGIETNFAISRQFKTHKPKPFSNCDGDTSNPNAFNFKLYKLIHSKNISYNQKLCIDLCFQDLIIQECKCFYGGYAFFGDQSIKPCFSYTDFKCYDPIIKNNLSDSSILKKICLPQCPLECNSMKFNILYSFNDFINEKNNEDLNSFYNFTGTNRRQMKKDLTLINLYYETLNYEEIIEKESIDFVGLLSNLGGIAGLFLGISFLSLVEIFEMAFQILYFFIGRTKIKQIKIDS
ncbi:unnamed protein product [Brachionus calyciflorus]|uniref:Uncharacterized protein n=1 Tax=Brachionus calyciflorus TaxID=104777 RepID=A0A813M847_9BILA|nr:unnamed protein product [Brachionus calyciflorus]